MLMHYLNFHQHYTKSYILTGRRECVDPHLSIQLPTQSENPMFKRFQELVDSDLPKTTN